MPFCTGCGARIETGNKCDACSGAAAPVTPMAVSTETQMGLGNWLNEMWMTFKSLLSGNPEDDWVMNNSQSAIWGAGGTAAVLMGIVVMLVVNSANSMLDFFSFGMGMFSAPKAFFLGLLGMVVLIGVLFGALYIIMAIGKSMALSWNLFGLAAYAGLFLAVVLMVGLIASKISPWMGVILFILGWAAQVQILNQGLTHLSDIKRSTTFYAVPAAISISVILLYVYLRIWIRGWKNVLPQLRN
jgi:hypothetical protein